MTNINEQQPSLTTVGRQDYTGHALNTVQAGGYTGLASATLETLRSRGGGPRFVKYGRRAVRYLRPDLDSWMLARTISSTSERVAA